MNTEEEVIEILQKMKDVLMDRGWCRGSLEDLEGRVCLYGARNVVLTGHADVFDLVLADAPYTPDMTVGALHDAIDSEFVPDGIRSYWRGDLTEWNDNEAQDFNSVIDMIDTAILQQKDKL